MTTDHPAKRNRPGSLVFGLAVGLIVAWWSYQWITNTENRRERAEQERVVFVSRELLATTLQLSTIDFVDPVEPDRKVGKTYVYPAANGFEVSGYYRRNADDEWHAYLMQLSGSDTMETLKVQDADANIAAIAAADSRLSVLP